MASDSKVDRHDPSLDAELEALLGDTPDEREKIAPKNPSHVTISLKDWELMKKQNLSILKELKAVRKEQKKKRSCSDTENSLSSAEPQAKKTKHNENTQDTDPDPDAQIEELMIHNVITMEKTSNDENLVEDDATECLDDIEQEYEGESDSGPAIHEKFAKLLLTMSKGKMEVETLKMKLEKHKRPQNCEMLIVPRVNPEIWAVMDNVAKSADLKTQKLQKNILKATIAMVKAGDMCVQSSSTEMKSTLRDITDAIGINLKTIHDLSMERRQKILSASNINQKYKKLASGEIEISDLLFGNDLKSVLSSIESSSKLGLSMTQSNRGRKFSPAFPKNGAWGFRGRGRGNQMWMPVSSSSHRGTRGRGQRSRGRWFQRNALQNPQ